MATAIISEGSCDWDESMDNLKIDDDYNGLTDHGRNGFVGHSIGRGKFPSAFSGGDNNDPMDGSQFNGVIGRGKFPGKLNSGHNSNSMDHGGYTGQHGFPRYSSGRGKFPNSSDNDDNAGPIVGDRANRENRGRRGRFGRDNSSFTNNFENTKESTEDDEFSQRKRKTECFKCRQEGHFARECPTIQNGENGETSAGFPKRKSGVCYNCQEEGHIAANCDQPATERKRGENDKVKPKPVTYIPEELGDDQLFDAGIAMGINFAAYDNVPVKVSGSGNIPPKANGFADTNLRNFLLENVARAGYVTPLPIQKHSIPIIMAGRDLMACAQTGSGKTVTFLLPILQYIITTNADCYPSEEPVLPTALILSPTRELTIQIYNEARKLAHGSIIKICICYGGTNVENQHNRLQKGCHVLVATTGRLLDYVERKRIAFNSLKILVLDEADRMLDLGFKGDIERILDHPTTPKKENRQTLMFSATFPEVVQELAKMYLKDYVFIVTGVVGSANVDVRQTILNMERYQKRDTLLEFVKDELAENENQKIMVFVETKRMADFVALYLSNNKLNVTSIHGDRVQCQREEALNEFKAGVRNILVSTSVAARGIDINGVGIVLNFDMPKHIEEYVHRIGRTGRVGNPGRAVSYFESSNDAHLAKDLVKLLGDAEQEVPEWLIRCSELDMGAASYGGPSNFGAMDIRRKGITMEEYPAAMAVGGPMQASGNAPNDEEMWG